MTTFAEPTGKKETRRLYCVLSQAEFNVRATEYAQTSQKLDELEGKKKQLADQFKERIGGVASKLRVLRRTVLDRKEPRDVPCTWHADWASKSMLLRRDDTGEVVEARTMTADELQGSFDLSAEDRRLPPKRKDDEGEDDEGDGEPLDG